MTTISKFNTPSAAGAEVDRRGARYMAEHGCGYKEAVHAILAADPELATAYAQPAARVTAMATKPARSQPVVPVTAGEEREIFDWIMRALKEDMVGWLPGELGSLTIEANNFKKIGLPLEEAARRAMDGNPHLVAMAKLLLIDLRRNAPSMPTDKAPAAELAQGIPAGNTVDNRAQALIAEHPGLDYREAVGVVLSEDPALKVSYARS